MKILLNIIAIASCIQLSTAHAEKIQVRKLSPPTITTNSVLEKIAATRPMRTGAFNISLETKADKTIVHCYGHGGSGFTTLWGSIKEAIELFESTHPDKTTPIRVLGAGCMGLCMAIDLDQRGYNVVGLSTKSRYDNPSWQASGYFALVSIQTSPEEEEHVNKLGLDTFLTYKQIYEGKHPYIPADTVRFLPVYCSYETDSGVSDLEKKGLIPQRQKVTLDFGNGVTHDNFYEYMTYFMNISMIMKHIEKELITRNVPIETKMVESFDDVSEEVIFNCTGLGSRELNHDEKMIAVRGHLFSLDPSYGTDHMDYMVYTKVKQSGKDEYVYVFPKDFSVTPRNVDGQSCAGIYGGTFVEHTDYLSETELQELDKREFKRMLDRNCLFFHGKTFEG